MDDIYSQFQRIKYEYPTHIALFRLGDFVEAFDEDAKVVAQVCGLGLTKFMGRPMAGFPFGAVEAEIGKLIAAGKYVALIEQLVPPVVPKGEQVKRLVVQESLFKDIEE